MRKLLILAAIAIVAPGAIGCQCGPIRNWLCDGYEGRCMQQCEPCSVPCSSPCGSTCNPAPTYGELMQPGMMQPGIVPGPVIQN